MRDLALTELSLSVGAAVTVFSELVPLLQWSSLGCDRAPNQVRFCSFVGTYVRVPYFRVTVAWLCYWPPDNAVVCHAVIAWCITKDDEETSKNRNQK